MSRYQKGKTNLDFTEARDSEWQWHQLGHTLVCTSLQTDNHASTPPLSFFTGRMPFLPPNQQRQSTAGDSLRKEFYCVVYYNFQHTFVPYARPPTHSVSLVAAYCYTCSVVRLSINLSVCLFITTVSRSRCECGLCCDEATRNDVWTLDSHGNVQL